MSKSLLGVVLLICLYSLVKYYIDYDFISEKIITSPSTSVCFIVSVFILFAMVRGDRQITLYLSLVLWSIVLFILIFCIFFVYIELGLIRSLNDININELLPGLLPSVGSILSFIVISAIGLFYSFSIKRADVKIKYLSNVLLLILSIAIIGHILNIPILYYQINVINISNGMSITSIICFLSIVFYLKINKKKIDLGIPQVK